MSGGGDGGLQDFLRALTRKKSGEEVLRELLKDTAVANAFQKRVPKLLSWEAESSRAYAWNDPDRRYNKKDDDAVFERLHKRHKEVVDDLFSAAAGVGAALCGKLDQLAVGDATLICREHGYFTYSYALNRFLVLLFERFLEEEGRAPRVFYDLEIDRVNDSGANKIVHFKAPSGATPQPTGGFDEVVIRHGVEMPKTIPTITRRAVQRQVLPFFS